MPRQPLAARDKRQKLPMKRLCRHAPTNEKGIFT
jgi:hypothetical protein